MARSFSAKDAKFLIEQHQETKKILHNAVMQYSHYESEIKKAASALEAEYVLDVLKKVPIEELNRDRRGIKVKALRDYGYQNIADIAGASAYQISSINGIGPESAYAIRAEADRIINQTKKNTKVRISTDHITPASTRLITSISRLRTLDPLANESRRLLGKYEKWVNGTIPLLTSGTDGIRWFFSSKKTKQRTEEAYQYLKAILDAEYGQSANRILAAMQRADHIVPDEAWRDFQSNSVPFINILEYYAPGILSSDDGSATLPQELIKGIQEEQFFPEGLLCSLRRYQEWGVKYILHQERVLLGDEMGLGKTIQAIAAMVSLKHTGATHFMVVCPASVITNWCREIKNKSKLSVIRIHGSNRLNALQSWIDEGGVAVTTYETTATISLSNTFRFSMLIVDEAHYIKNPEAQRTTHVKNISMHADRLLFLTGTALENKVDEMINLIKILQPAIAEQVRGMEFLSSAPIFRRKIAPVSFRRKREEVLTELPEMEESKEWCTLLPQEESIYEKAILSKQYADARRVSWNVGNLNQSSKARRMMEIIKEAEEEGRKILVFSFFLDTISTILRALGSRCVGPINGSVPVSRRQSIIDEFEKAPAGTVLAAQIQSGGTGLNIQSASVVILCEPQFKPSIENQAISRAYRMGQTRNVLVYRLLCENTVDEKITELLEQKQQIFDAFADKSVAAKNSIELDSKSFGNIIEEEIERIKRKAG